MVAKDGRYYHKLTCSHVRMVDLNRIEVIPGETSVYCRLCDTHQTVVGKVSRWHADRDN